MKKIDSKKIALSAMSTTVSIISIYLSFVINTLSITFMVIAAIALMLLLTQGYLRAAVLCYIATSIIGGILVGFLPALSYILFFGLYTIVSYLINLKIKSNIIRIIIKALFFLAVIYPVVYLSKILIGETFLNFISKSALHYLLFFAFAVLVMFLYDYLMNKMFPIIRNYVSRAIGKKVLNNDFDNKKTVVKDNYDSDKYDKKDDDVFKF